MVFARARRPLATSPDLHEHGKPGNIGALFHVYGGVVSYSVKVIGSIVGLLPKVMAGAALLLATSVHAALDPVVPHCASVAVNGDVQLGWSAPPDPGGEFAEYRIYHANAAGGPFFQLATLPLIGMISYTHVGAGADAGPQFYYITTFTTGPDPQESIPSDTVATLFLQVFQSTPPGNADLSWNALGVAPTADDTFQVWMEYPIGTWQQISTTAATSFSYQHVVSVCEDSLTFRVHRSDDTGCNSQSNVGGDVFQDVTPPTSPTISLVTVDTLSGLATVEWQPSPQDDTDGYIIVFQAPGGAVIIDTIFGQFNTTYAWDESTAGIGPESYTVAAFDTCEVGVPPSPNTSATRPMHTTMFLDYVYDECGARVDLAWSAYIGWEVEEYNVHVQVDGGLWGPLASVDGAMTSFSHPVEPFRTYCFAIVAAQREGTSTSLSNKTCVVTDYPGLPAFNYIRTVTVSGASQITIVDSVDVAAVVQGYRLERSVNGGAFETVDTRGAVLSPLIVFTDDDVSPGTTSYRYQVVVLDGCGNGTLTSNVGANILLTATAGLDGNNVLDWNGYENWSGPILAHSLHRQVDQEPFTVLDIVGAFPWNYSDNVSALTGSTGRFCYYVEAIETANPSGINASSRSNVACAVQEELVFIPNAIVLGGANPLFAPVLAYADVSEYELTIINRWGQVFWTTDDPLVPWNGTHGGAPVPVGLYAYYCSFKNGAGRVFEKRGTVTVLSAWE